jgi:phosphoglycolate phosphatase
MSIELIIFDCDGVLFDSRQANRVYYSTLAQDFGRPPLTDQETDYVHCHTVFESVDHIFRETPEVVEAAHKVRTERGYGPFFKLMIPEPGIYECLERLKQRFELAVFTNRADTITGVLETHRMNDYFGMVVSCLDVAKPKPDPEGLHKIMEATGIGPEEAVYIGDALGDSQSANAAGVHFIAYKNPKLPDRAAYLDDFDRLEKTLESL